MTERGLLEGFNINLFIPQVSGRSRVLIGEFQGTHKDPHLSAIIEADHGTRPHSHQIHSRLDQSTDDAFQEVSLSFTLVLHLGSGIDFVLHFLVLRWRTTPTVY